MQNKKQVKKRLVELELPIGESLELQGKAGEALLIVDEGLVKLVEERKGWETTLDIFGDAICLEELALFAPVFESHRLVALYSSRLLRLDKPLFAEYLKSHPEVGWQILVNVANLASQRNPVSELYRQPLEIRLARQWKYSECEILLQVVQLSVPPV
jgi:CRP-like cAMP-binding protein